VYFVLLSRRDSTIVARHEVPGLQFGHLEKVAVEEPDWVFAPEGAV
jgi:hypothetical protein